MQHPRDALDDRSSRTPTKTRKTRRRIAAPCTGFDGMVEIGIDDRHVVMFGERGREQERRDGFSRPSLGETKAMVGIVRTP